MQLTDKDRLFVLTGAGISAESGLATFRGSGGLWNGYRVEQVATPEAWEADPSLVWNFYSMRRRDALAAEPNAAHRALATLEERMGDRFYLCTQNVDDLHERAGSRRGLVAFRATVLGENRRALPFLRRLSPAADVRFRDAEYQVYAPFRGRAAERSRGRSVTR